MKFRMTSLAVAMSAALAFQPVFAQDGELESDTQRYSYMMGMDIARTVANMPEGVDVDSDAFMRGFNDVLSDRDTLLSEEEYAQVRQNFQKMIQERATEQRQRSAQENLEQGQAFLAENAERDGVMVTDSGLQYEVVQEGEGASPSETDRVTVHYKGTTTDGEVFDSSYERGEPATFALNGVIPGWTEGLQLMKEGAKYKFYIPSELAYGEQGARGAIGPNEVLIFEVELQEVAEKQQASE